MISGPMKYRAQLNKEVYMEGYMANEWVYGHYYEDPGDVHQIIDQKHGLMNVNPKTVSQFSGLLDNNDVEMYAGDVFKIDQNYLKAMENHEILIAGKDPFYRDTFLLGFSMGCFMYGRGIDPYDFDTPLFCVARESNKESGINFYSVPLPKRLNTCQVVGNITDHPGIVVPGPEAFMASQGKDLKGC